jgi:hypothetical protein
VRLLGQCRPFPVYPLAHVQWLPWGLVSVGRAYGRPRAERVANSVRCPGATDHVVVGRLEHVAPSKSRIGRSSLLVGTAVTRAPSLGVGVCGNTTQFGGSLGTSAGSNNSGIIGPTAFYSPTNIAITATSGSFTGGTARTDPLHAVQRANLVSPIPANRQSWTGFVSIARGLRNASRCALETRPIGKYGRAMLTANFRTWAAAEGFRNVPCPQTFTQRVRARIPGVYARKSAGRYFVGVKIVRTTLDP